MMLDRKWMLDNETSVRANLTRRGENFGRQLSDLMVQEKKRKELLQRVEDIRHQRNALQAQFKENAEHDVRDQMKKLSTQLSDWESELKVFEESCAQIVEALPNILHPNVPLGSTSEDNVEVYRDEKDLIGHKNKPVVPHWQLQGEHHGIDFQHASNMSGARFYVLRGDFARLERALINFMLDTHKAHGYTEMMVPYMVNEQSMFGSGQFPKLRKETFKIEERDLYLIPTAEVPLINYFQDMILDEKDLDFFLAAFSPCFRAEAGSYGVDTRGLIRLHQFHKVELVKITHPDRSEPEHQKMVQDGRRILDLLGIPYRVMMLCSGDTGFASMLTYDLEVWVPSQGTFREISSLSNCGDFQARRAKIRFRPKQGDKKTQYVHTLNGSGLAVGRTLLTLCEYFQDGENKIVLPEVLHPYMGGQTTISW